MDRIRSLLIALLVCGGISTLVAESSNDAYQTAYLLKISASGNELTGSATVKLINQDGSVAETRNVTLTGVRASKRLVAKPST
jgi:hypothetical protein